MSQTPWKYSRRHPSCVDCEREFADGEAHFSVLRVDEEAALLRDDVCASCWNDEREASGDLWWRTHRHIERKAGLQVDMEALDHVFHQLADRKEERFRELRYVLCLLLMRKRRLILGRATRRRGGEFLLVRRPRRKEEIEVEVFDLGAERLDQVRAMLQSLFEGEGLTEEGALAGEGGESSEGESEAGGPGQDGGGPEVTDGSEPEGGGDSEAVAVASEPDDAERDAGATS